MDKPTEGAGAGEEAKKPEHHHYAAPEVEERDVHEYEGEGVGRRESLRPDKPVPAAAAKKAEGEEKEEGAKAE